MWMPAHTTAPPFETAASASFLARFAPGLIPWVYLVAAVVLLFLQDWKAMILPMIDVPVSLLGAFIMFQVSGLWQ